MLRISKMALILILILLVSSVFVIDKIHAEEPSPTPTAVAKPDAGIDPLSLIIKIFSLNLGGMIDSVKGALDVTEAKGVRSMRELFTEIESKVGVPTKILEAVFIIEAPGQYKALSGEDLQRYSQPGQKLPNCTVNECSAAGPMQMTTGKDSYGRSNCPACGSIGYCPNMWSQYRNAVNDLGGYSHLPEVCNLRDNLYGAAKKLKDDSGAAGLQWTQAQVYRAATRYYGSCAERFRYVRLGGRTYCEFLWMFYNANL